MIKVSKVGRCIALLIGFLIVTESVLAATTLTATRTVDSVYYTAASKIEGIQVTVVPATGSTSNAVITESTRPVGFTISNMQTTNGSAEVTDGVIVWTLSGASSQVEMTYDLTAPASNPPLYAKLGGVAEEGTTKVVMETTLRHEPGLGPKWIVGANDGIWAIMDGVLRVYADGNTDPKHAWVDLGLTDGNYSVTCDCRMVNWVDGDLPRAGISIRINPDDNGNNVGSDRGINLLFHNDQNSIDMLNDLVAWGTASDIPWEVGSWYTFGLTGYDTIVDAFFIEQGVAGGLSNEAYLNSWIDDALATRSPGYPGLAGSSQSGLEVQFDNFKVYDVDGNVIFEDDFETVVTTPLTAQRTLQNTTYQTGGTISGITVNVIPSSGRTSNAVVTETIPDGFTPANIHTTNGTASYTGNTIVWTLVDAMSKVTMTYDLTVIDSFAPFNGAITGMVQDGSWKISMDSTSLSLTSNLGNPWVIGSGGGIWVVSDGVLRAYSDNATDPKHAWVDLDLNDGNYTVKCDCRMVTWADADLSRAGIAIRINPDDNGANVGSDRGVTMLFHNDQNSIDLLNDLVAWGTLTDTAWETGTWYTFALVGDGTIVDAYFSEQGSVDPLGDDAYLTSWDAEALDTRSPGFPGLTASSRAGLEVQFDNFQVIKDGAVLFEDTFDKATSVSEWSVY